MKTLAASEADLESKSPIDIAVTQNEVSVPTSTNYLARLICQVITDGIKMSMIHGVPNDSCSRSYFATYILESLISCYDNGCFVCNGSDSKNTNAICEKLRNVTVLPVERHGLWPEFSQMTNINSPYFEITHDLNYKHVIDEFITGNFRRLVEFCENEYAKAGGKLDK